MITFVEDKKPITSVSFNVIKEGDVFSFSDSVFIKRSFKEGLTGEKYMNAMWLSEHPGGMCHFDDTVFVEPIEVEIKLKRN